MPDPLIGRRLGKYLIQQEIGRGGMARVYRASDTVLQRPVALKVLAPTLSADPEFAQRFEREAITAANLRHPAIVTIFDVGEADGLRYIAMEYIGGRTLNDVLEEQGRLGLPLTIAILAPVADALDFAHTHGMVHRDVKPHNIMIDTDGRVLLTDFGIAIDPAEGGERLTRTGMFMGTPEYISPEQAQAQPLSGRSDLYSLGIVAYEMLAGRVPFDGGTPQQIMAHVYQAPPPLTTWDRGSPPELDQIFARVLAKDPQQRFERAGNLVEALRYVARRYGLPTATRAELAALAVPRDSSAGQATVAMRTPPGVPVAPSPAQPTNPPQRATPPAAFPIGEVFGGVQNAARPQPQPQRQPSGQAPTLPMTTPATGTPTTSGRTSGAGSGGPRATGGRAYPYGGDDFVPPPRVPRQRGYDDDGGSNVPWTFLALGGIAIVTILLILFLTRDQNGLFAAGTTPVPSRNPFQASATDTPQPTATNRPTAVLPTLVINGPTPPPEFTPAPPPTLEPTIPPTTAPTEAPTALPTIPPTQEPSIVPTAVPSEAPTEAPTLTPTAIVTPTATLAPATPTAPPTSTALPLPSATVAPSGVPTPVGGGGRIGYFADGKLEILDPATGQQPESFDFNFDTQSAPAISPDGATILVDIADKNGQDRQIVAIDRASGKRTPLTKGAGVNMQPSWRPDGKAIVFAATKNGKTDIYTMNPDGSNVRQITDGQGVNQYPSFSPDGTRIVFESTRDGPNWAIFTIDPQGGPVTRLSPQQSAVDRSPRWSPDGQAIAFVSNRERPDGNFEVYAMRGDGSDAATAQRLTTFTSGTVDGPTWSPDGTLIALFGNQRGNNDLYIVERATGKIQPGPASDANERWPIWSK